MAGLRYFGATLVPVLRGALAVRGARVEPVPEPLLAELRSLALVSYAKVLRF